MSLVSTQPINHSPLDQSQYELRDQADNLFTFESILSTNKISASSQISSSNSNQTVQSSPSCSHSPHLITIQHSSLLLKLLSRLHDQKHTIYQSRLFIVLIWHNYQWLVLFPRLPTWIHDMQPQGNSTLMIPQEELTLEWLNRSYDLFTFEAKAPIIQVQIVGGKATQDHLHLFIIEQDKRIHLFRHEPPHWNYKRTLRLNGHDLSHNEPIDIAAIVHHSTIFWITTTSKDEKAKIKAKDGRRQEDANNHIFTSSCNLFCIRFNENQAGLLSPWENSSPTKFLLAIGEDEFVSSFAAPYEGIWIIIRRENGYYATRFHLYFYSALIDQIATIPCPDNVVLVQLHPITLEILLVDQSGCIWTVRPLVKPHPTNIKANVSARLAVSNLEIRWLSQMAQFSPIQLDQTQLLILHSHALCTWKHHPKPHLRIFDLRSGIHLLDVSLPMARMQNISKSPVDSREENFSPCQVLEPVGNMSFCIWNHQGIWELKLHSIYQYLDLLAHLSAWHSSSNARLIGMHYIKCSPLESAARIAQDLQIHHLEVQYLLQLVCSSSHSNLRINQLWKIDAFYSALCRLVMLLESPLVLVGLIERTNEPKLITTKLIENTIEELKTIQAQLDKTQNMAGHQHGNQHDPIDSSGGESTSIMLFPRFKLYSLKLLEIYLQLEKPNAQIWPTHRIGPNLNNALDSSSLVQMISKLTTKDLIRMNLTDWYMLVHSHPEKCLNRLEQVLGIQQELLACMTSIWKESYQSARRGVWKMLIHKDQLDHLFSSAMPLDQMNTIDFVLLESANEEYGRLDVLASMLALYFQLDPDRLLPFIWLLAKQISKQDKSRLINEDYIYNKALQSCSEWKIELMIAASGEDPFSDSSIQTNLQNYLCLLIVSGRWTRVIGFLLRLNKSAQKWNEEDQANDCINWILDLCNLVESNQTEYTMMLEFLIKGTLDIEIAPSRAMIVKIWGMVIEKIAFVWLVEQLEHRLKLEASQSIVNNNLSTSLGLVLGRSAIGKPTQIGFPTVEMLRHALLQPSKPLDLEDIHRHYKQ